MSETQQGIRPRNLTAEGLQEKLRRMDAVDQADEEIRSKQGQENRERKEREISAYVGMGLSVGAGVVATALREPEIGMAMAGAGVVAMRVIDGAPGAYRAAKEGMINSWKGAVEVVARRKQSMEDSEEMRWENEKQSYRELGSKVVEAPEAMWKGGRKVGNKIASVIGKSFAEARDRRQMENAISYLIKQSENGLVDYKVILQLCGNDPEAADKISLAVARNLSRKLVVNAEVEVGVQPENTNREQGRRNKGRRNR